MCSRWSTATLLQQSNLTRTALHQPDCHVLQMEYCTATESLPTRTALQHSVVSHIPHCNTTDHDVLQVEYCTATRPSSTLRGSTEQYSRAVTEIKEKSAVTLWEYHATILDNRCVCVRERGKETERECVYV